MATINALANTKEGLIEGDALELVKIPEDARVGMIGYFSPYVKALKDKTRLYVFEIKPREEDFVYPWYAEFDLLPYMDYVIITGTTIVNLR